MSSQVPGDAIPPPSSAGDDHAPRSAPERVWLLLILVILPVLAVSLPAILVTAIFGQHPKSASGAPDIAGLRTALERNAQNVMTPPPALGEEPILLTVRPDHLPARAGWVGALARQWGGSVTEGLPRGDGQDLYVDLPAASVAGFRAAATARPGDSPSPAPSARPSTTSSAGGLVHLEVRLRTARDDE